MTFTAEVVSDAQARYTGLINEKWKHGAQELLANPMAWASYAAWLAVWLTVSAVSGPPGAGFTALADALLFVWLATSPDIYGRLSRVKPVLMLFRSLGAERI